LSCQFEESFVESRAIAEPGSSESAAWPDGDTQTAPCESSARGPSGTGLLGSGRFVLTLLVLGFVLQVGFFLLIRRHATADLLEVDEHEYWGIATDLMEGGLARFPVSRTLGFPLLIALIRSLVGDDYARVQFVLTSLLVLLGPLVYWLSRRAIGSERAARVAALGVLCWPVFLRLGVTLFSDPITLMLFALYLNVFHSAWHSRSLTGMLPGRWSLAGAILGICIHFRPMYLIYSPIAFALALWDTQSLRRGLQSAVLLTLGCLLVVLPWSTYLSLREGRFLLLCTNDGATLSGGLNPALAEMKGYEVHYTPEGRPFWWGPGGWIPPTHSGLITSEESLTLAPIEANALLLKRTKEWISTHPREVAYLTVMKLLYMWGIHPFWWSMYSFPSALLKTVTGNCAILAVLTASFVAVIRLRRHLRALAIFWSLPLFVTLVACLSLGNWRYRMPGDLGLIVLASTLLAYSEINAYLTRNNPNPQTVAE
jgi:hypothetical protein